MFSKFFKSSKYSEDFPTCLNPYNILGVKINSSKGEVKSAYHKLSTEPDRHIRSIANLAYDMLCNKNKYISKGNNEYEIKKKIYFIILQ